MKKTGLYRVHSGVKLLVLFLFVLPLVFTLNCGGGGGGSEPKTTSISGRITMPEQGGRGVAGLSVYAQGIEGGTGCSSGPYSTVTDSDGYYSFSNSNSSISNATATVWPGNADNYEFYPTDRSFTINYGDHITGQDFVATHVYFVSGTLTNPDTTPAPNITIGLFDSNGRLLKSATSSADGTYSLAAPSGINGLVLKPQGYTSNPSSRTINYLTANLTGQDFIITGIVRSTISGRVTASGLGIADISVQLIFQGGNWILTSTDTDGYYTFTGLLNGPYTVQLATSCNVSPLNYNLQVNGADITGVDFTLSAPAGYYSIGGYITNVAGGSAPGVSVLISPPGITEITDVNGHYSTQPIQAGIYELTPSMQGYVFNPVLKRIVLCSDGTGGNFTAIPSP